MGGLIFTVYTFTCTSSLIDILWLSLNDKLCCIALWWWVGCTFKDQLSPLLTIHSSLNLHLHIFNFATFPQVAGKKLKIMPHLLNEPFFTTGWKYCPIRKVKQIFWSLNVIYNIMIKAPNACLLCMHWSVHSFSAQRYSLISIFFNFAKKTIKISY